MVEFWDEKYSGKDFHYGTEPNEFFKAYIDNEKNKKLNILFPADGEGRNSVYAAKSGHCVYSFDQSTEARKKAMRLADNYGTKIRYEVADVMQYESELKFDLIIMIYFHLPPDLRKKSNRKFIEMLNDGGKILIEAFNKNQINNSSGGPKVIGMPLLIFKT